MITANNVKAIFWGLVAGLFAALLWMQSYMAQGKEITVSWEVAVPLLIAFIAGACPQFKRPEG